MRQRSASDQDDSWNAPSAPFARNPGSTRHRPSAPKVAPRFSLPQRPVSADAVKEEWREETLQPARKQKRSQKPSTQALVVHSAETSPLALPEPASPADLHLIPRTSPALPAVSSKQGWFHPSSPRVTIIKLSLIALVMLSVLGATFATAGGGNANFLFHALESVIPFSAPAQPAGPTTVAQRVQPIIQADLNAGYDSRQQHDDWWASACSAAAMTELLHAWGMKDVTIGQLIDLMSAHIPPYITTWGGLMSQDGWGYVMSSYHLQATVHQNRSMSYNEVVRMTEEQGIPVVIGLRDNAQRYFPAFAGGGHLLLAVGGDASGLRMVDSSLYRITSLPYDEFNDLWTGLTVVIRP